LKEIIIVGVGIVGASTSYELAKRGFKVTMIDSHTEGRATSAGAGIISPWITQRRNKAWYELAKNGAAHYKSLINELDRCGEKETGYKQNGAIHLHQNIEQLKKLKNIALKRREDAPEIGNVHILNEKETLDKFPLLNEGYSSLYVKGAARIDGRALRDSLINAAKKHGAKYIKATAQLNFSKECVLGVRINGDTIGADATVLTNGVWMKEILLPLQLNFDVKMQKGQLVHVYEEQLRDGDFPVVKLPRDPYIVPFDEGRVVIGATREDNAKFDPKMTVGGVHEVLHKTLEVAPKFFNSTISDIRIGFRPYTKTFVPTFGTVPHYERLFLANGLGASGLTTGPYIGKLLAQMVAEENIDIDHTLYKVEEHIKVIR